MQATKKTPRPARRVGKQKPPRFAEVEDAFVFDFFYRLLEGPTDDFEAFLASNLLDALSARAKG